MKINYFKTHFFCPCCGVEFAKVLVELFLEPTVLQSFWEVLPYTSLSLPIQLVLKSINNIK